MGEDSESFYMPSPSKRVERREGDKSGRERASGDCPQIGSREGLEHEERAHENEVPGSPLLEVPVPAGEKEGEKGVELHLDMWQAVEGKGGEGEEEPREERGEMIPGEGAREDVHRHGGRPHGEEQEQIVREDQIVREAQERECQDSEEREMFGVGERMRKGVKGIRLEETQGIVNHLVSDPGNRPGVQARVAVVEPREACRMKGERGAQYHRGAGG